MTIHSTAIVVEDTVVHGECSVGPFAVVGVDGADVGHGPAEIFDRATVSSHAVVNRGVRLGSGSVVLPGAVVDRDVPGNAIVGGNPAQIVGYRDPVVAGPAPLVEPGRGDSDVPVDGVLLLAVRRALDLRGALTAVECGVLPFDVRRIFTVNDVPDGNVRGAHAHRVCHQFLWCVTGSLRCLVDDGRRRAEVILSADGAGLYMPPGTWGTQYRYTTGTVLNVAASHAYDSTDYIREYEDFIRFKAAEVG